jgi:hypothetical protein
MLALPLLLFSDDLLPVKEARILLVMLCAAEVAVLMLVKEVGEGDTYSSCSGPSSGMVGWLRDLQECFLWWLMWASVAGGRARGESTAIIIVALAVMVAVS